MKTIKRVLLIIIPILVLILSCFLFIKLQDEKVGVSTNYQIYVNFDSLIWFSFDNKENPLVTNYKFTDEGESKQFSEFDFIGMNLNAAIEKYLELKRTSGVKLANVYLWTNWNNENYFEGKNYKLNIVDDETINQVPEIIKPKLLYNQKYYKVEDDHNYNIVIKEDWSLEYHVDEYITTYCDEYMEDACFEATINDQYYESTSKAHTYSLSEGKITIKAKENDTYFGWVYSYDECEIMYNSLKCDYYNGYHTNNPEYQHTVYYEIR